MIATAAKLSLLLVALAVPTALVACGDDQQDSSVPSTAVARVGDKLLSKDRVRGFMPPQGSPSERRMLAARRVVLHEWLLRDAKREGHAEWIDEIKVALVKATASTKSLRQAQFLSLLRRMMFDAAQPMPTATSIARYYRDHRQDFAHPQTRFLRLVAADSQAKAAAAKRALQAGAPWKTVIDRYSKSRDVMPASGDLGTERGEQPAALDKSIYAARVGAVTGPVATDEAWYVFQLTSIDSRPAQSLAEVRDRLRTELIFKRGRQGDRLLARRLLDRYRAMTICGPDFQLPECGNTQSGGVADMLALFNP